MGSHSSLQAGLFPSLIARKKQQQQAQQQTAEINAANSGDSQAQQSIVRKSGRTSALMQAGNTGISALGSATYKTTLGG